MAKFVFNPLSGGFDTVLDKASEISYDNATSGLTATNTQAALDEIEGRLDATETVANAAIPLTQKGASNGVATLDAGGKVPASQLPNSVMEYKGMWDASTNTPTLANGTGNAGDVYEASAAGSVDFGAGSISFNLGDWAVYSGSVWQKSINSNAVASVNGFTGIVVLDTDDVSEGSTNLYFSDARAQAAITGGASTIVTANLTADRALVSNGSGKVSASAITGTELGYLSGVTSNIQTQLNAVSGVSVTTIKTSAYAANLNEVVLVNTGSGSFAITLPPVIAPNQQVIIKDAAGVAEAFQIEVSPVLGAKIDGTVGSLLITSNYGSVRLISNNTDWYII